jgi:hypothetical protein
MDPYLEHPHHWQDFHARFIVAAADALVPQLRPVYMERIGVDLYLNDELNDQKYLADHCDESFTATRFPLAENNAASMTAPVTGRVELAVVEEKSAYIEVLDRESRTVVAVIELLSPSNKQPGSDREQYLAKRMRLLKSSVHLLEIDLLRDGPRMPVENLPPCDYAILASRWEDRPDVQLWPVQLRERLPVVPVPLKERDASARIDLQEIVNRVYDAAGYADYIYGRPLVPSLKAADAQWAAELLKRSSAI